MTKHRIRFEPIDIDTEKDYFEGKTIDDFAEYYARMIEIIRAGVSDSMAKYIPDIRKIYPVDNEGFPL